MPDRHRVQDGRRLQRVVPVDQQGRHLRAGRRRRVRLQLRRRPTGAVRSGVALAHDARVGSQEALVRKLALLLGLFAATLSGCKNDTYCLNCQSADGMPADMIPPDDLLPPPDLTEPPDLLPPADLTVLGPDGGPCMPTNGGIEKCDGLDNDCN